MKLSTVDAFKHIRSADCYYLTAEELAALQGTLKEILFDVAGLCEANGIPYTLAGGTALGAVRHRGFIPWDDDVDLLMTRDSYRRLVQVLERDRADRYWVHTPGVTKDYPLLLGRVLKKGTELRTREDFRNDECGVFIDIFFMENTPDSALLRRLHGLTAMALGFIVSCRKFFRDRRQLLPMAGEDRALARVFRVKILLGFFTAFLSLDAWTRLADRWNGICKNNDSRYIAVPAGRRHYFGELYPRADLCVSEPCPFEDRTLMLMRGRELYLTRLFGEYTKLPAEDEREAHAFLSKPLL